MKITDLLTEINIEVHRLIAVNSNSQDGIDQTTLKRFKSMFEAINSKSINLDKSLGFFEKIELKKDLKKLKKSMQNTSTDDKWKVFEASNILTKLCSKYGVEYVHDTPMNVDLDQILREREESFNPGLEDRIGEAFKSAREKRAKYGVRADTPVTSLNVNEINEAAERTARIDSIMAKKKAEEQERMERAARVSAAIDKKRAEQKSRSIGSYENSRYESIMARKIKALLQEFDDDVESDKGDTVSIRYELQNNTYYLDGEPILKRPKRLITLKEKEGYIRSKLRNQSEFGFLFDLYIPDDRKALKECDPYIIGLLISKDIRLAKDYIRQMTGIDAKKISPQNLKVTYDVRGLESGKVGSITSKERRSIRKMAKRQKNVAKVIEDKRKLPWYAAIPFVGALAIAGIAGITSANNSNQNNDRDNFSGNSYSDTVEPGVATEKSTTAYNPGYEYTTEFSTETTTAATETVTTPSQDKTEIDKPIDEDVETPSIKESDKEEKITINIGDKINVQEGLKYTADCLGGGNSNRIGAVSWRPATEYNVERVAFVYQGKILKIMNRGDLDVENTLNDVARQNGINAENINTSVLLSLVPGTADTGWANISLDDMRQNLSKPIEEQSSMISHIDFDFDR